MDVSRGASERAEEILEELGLTEYEAKCFLGLMRASSATASELSKLCGVPRSRIYDVSDRLAESGFVEIETGETKRYRAVPIEMAINKFQREYQSLIAELEERLYGLEAPDHGGDDGGVWTVHGRRNVRDRTRAVIDTADEELFLLVERDELLPESFLRRIEAARNRGVRIVVVTESADVRGLLADHVADCTFLDGAGDVLGLPVQDGALGRIVMADRETVLVATLKSSDPDADSSVMGIWGSGPENGFVAVLSQLLGSWIDNAPPLSSTDEA